MTNHELWQSVLAELELEISKTNFNTWFRNTDIMNCQDGHIVLCVPTAFSQGWLEKHYNNNIVKSLERITGKPVKKLEYKICSIKNMPAQADAGDTPKT